MTKKEVFAILTICQQLKDMWLPEMDMKEVRKHAREIEAIIKKTKLELKEGETI